MRLFFFSLFQNCLLLITIAHKKNNSYINQDQVATCYVRITARYCYDLKILFERECMRAAYFL